MASQLDIYNLALGRIGSDKSVASVNEASKEARLCNRFYAQCRDEVLEAAAFPFAVKVQALALVPSNLQLNGWQHQYARPDEALRILEVGPLSEAGSAVGYWTSCCGPWEAHKRDGMMAYRQILSDDGNTSAILANVPQAYGIFVARVTNASVFSPLMVSTVANRLAVEIAMPLTGDARFANLAMQRYNMSFADAASAQYEQSQDGPDREPASIRARW